jgi:hypothetical protein
MTATSKPRVLYWNNIPTPYTVERFNVARRGTLDFEAWSRGVSSVPGPRRRSDEEAST